MSLILSIFDFCGLSLMDLELYITKHYSQRSLVNWPKIRFAVLDKDKASKYPENFLCLLPKQINPKLKQKHKFIQLFGNESPKIAQDLLNNALDSTGDPEIAEAIRKRLKKIKPRSVFQIKCKLCGFFFEPNFKDADSPRICSDCKQRIYV